MREDQESLVRQALDDDIGHGLRFESAGGKEVQADVPLSGEHVRLDALRTQAGHPNAVLSVGNGEPLEERERGRLRDPIWGRELVIEETRRRDSAHQVALLALAPLGP